MAFLVIFICVYSGTICAIQLQSSIKVSQKCLPTWNLFEEEPHCLLFWRAAVLQTLFSFIHL